MCSNVYDDVTEFEVIRFSTKILIYWEQSTLFSLSKSFGHNTLRAMITQIDR